MNNYIIKTKMKGYFCGWNMFGGMKFIEERRLAYRMRSNVAETTAQKINNLFNESCEIISL